MIDNLTEETTLHNGRQCQQMRHCCPSHLARDCDPIRISAKILDEMLHELQSQKYVQETRIAGYLIRLGRQEAEWSKAILWCNQHDILLEQVVGRCLRVAALVQVLPMYIDQHWQLPRYVRRADRHCQTILDVQHIVQSQQ